MRKSPRKARKLGQPLPYSCPICSESFWNETTEHRRQISLHRIMHVVDLNERWKLIEDWKRHIDSGGRVRVTA
jgi:hypothetical protein